MEFLIRYPDRCAAHLTGGQTAGPDQCILLGSSHVHLYNSKSVPLNRDAAASSTVSASALKRKIHKTGIWTIPDSLSVNPF
jgi:hypothetical protein